MKACVDVGGTKIAVSLSDGIAASPGGLPVLQARRSEFTAKSGGNDAVALQILRMLGQACAEAAIAESDIEAVGVASCGPFVMQGGMIELAAPNICGGLAGPGRGLPNDWTSAILEAPLRKKYPNLHIANDGIGALQAERRWGALQGLNNCAYVTWSTGIGFGLCVDGHVLHGKQGNAGHAGHMFVSDVDEHPAVQALCGCGNIGDVEGLVAGNAIARRFAPEGFADAAALLSAAQQGNAHAVAAVDGLCRVMGRTLYNLVITLDLQRISMGGSVFSHHRQYLLPRVLSHIHGKLPALTDGFELVPAGLGERVGDFGALALISPPAA